MKTPVSGSTLFTDAMALTPAGDGRYDGELNEHWTIGPKGSGPKVHGGAMLALCANAARLEHAVVGAPPPRSEGGGIWPVAISGNFLWAPDPGPMRVTTTVRKRGRRVSLIDVELRQVVRTTDERSREEERVAVHAAVTMGDPEHHVPPLSPSSAVGPFGQPGGAVDDPGAAARTGADRAGPPDGRSRQPGSRLRHPALADHIGASHRRRSARDRVLGPPEGRSTRPAVRAVL